MSRSVRTLSEYRSLIYCLITEAECRGPFDPTEESLAQSIAFIECLEDEYDRVCQALADDDDEYVGYADQDVLESEVVPGYQSVDLDDIPF